MDRRYRLSGPHDADLFAPWRLWGSLPLKTPPLHNNGMLQLFSQVALFTPTLKAASQVLEFLTAATGSARMGRTTAMPIRTVDLTEHCDRVIKSGIAFGGFSTAPMEVHFTEETKRS